MPHLACVLQYRSDDWSVYVDEMVRVNVGFFEKDDGI